MSDPLLIPPSNIPFIDKAGFVTAPWRTFFTTLLSRVYGSNGELQAHSSLLDAIAADSTAGFILQTSASAISKQAAGISATKTTLTSVTIQNGVITAWS